MPYKSGYLGIAFCIYVTQYTRRIRVDVHIATINQFQPEGWPRKYLLHSLSLDVLHCVEKMGTRACDTPCCVPCKYTKIVNLKFQYKATQFFSVYSYNALS